MHLVQWLDRWVQRVCVNAKSILVLLVLATTGFSWYSIEKFRMNSNLGDLIHQEAPWRDAFEAFKAKFPMLVDNGVVVVSGDSFGAVEQVSLQIEARMKQHPELYRDVYSPANEPFFRDNALLYLDVITLDEVVTQIAQAQPILAAISQEPSLVSLIQLVSQGYENAQDNDFGAQSATVLLDKIVESGERVIAGQDAQVMWIDEFIQKENQQIRTIFFKGVADFSQSLPNALAIVELRKLIATIPAIEGVSIGLTGEIVLSHEEVEAAFAGIKIAGYVSLALLLVILAIGVRSVSLIAATFAMLFVGIIWTSAWAMVSVGEFNTLSIVFLVMFFGLGVDFAIHFGLCFQESNESSKPLALSASAKKIGGAIGLCTVTTAVGFLAYAPTDYRGLADLGIISAGGMVIACFLTFTLLPALLTLFGTHRPATQAIKSDRWAVSWLINHRTSVVGTCLALVLGAGFFAKDAYFDYSVLALRDASSGSMVALRKLNQEGQVTNYSLNIVAQKNSTRVTELNRLSSVRSILTLEKIIPKNQEEKNILLEDLGFLLGDLFTKEVVTPPADEQQSILAIESLSRSMPDAALVNRLKLLLTSIKNQTESFEHWERAVTKPLVDEFRWLGRAVIPRTVQFADLPSQLSRRFLTDAGETLVIVIPEADVAEVSALSAFVRQVTQVHEKATGRPAIELGVGTIVQQAFAQSLLYALAGVFLVLLIALRKITDSLLIIVPLLLTSVCTLGVCVLMDVPLNMANVLVLPLIFGLGVDNGLHVVERFRKTGSVAGLMRSSTPRAVVLSTLTTMGTFAALMLSPHQGTASIGFLLTVAISFLLMFTVILLPALLSYREN